MAHPIIVHDMNTWKHYMFFIGKLSIGCKINGLVPTGGRSLDIVGEKSPLACVYLFLTCTLLLYSNLFIDFWYTDPCDLDFCGYLDHWPKVMKKAYIISGYKLNILTKPEVNPPKGLGWVREHTKRQTGYKYYNNNIIMIIIIIFKS